MTISKQLLEKAGIKPRLKLGEKLEGGGVRSTGPHKVIFLADRTKKGNHPVTGVERDEVEYTFAEDGMEKTYSVAVKNDKGELNYFIQRMAEFNPTDHLVLEMKKKGIKNYIDVSPLLEEDPDVIAYDEEPGTSSESDEEPVESPKQEQAE